MNKRRILVVLLLIAALICGCGKTDEVPQMGDDDVRFITIYVHGTNYCFEQIWVDRATGVQYLFVKQGKGGGLTPLLNADGTPYTGETHD